jgi:parvulin-like peptidyl-prolyl isomerase
VRHFSRQSLPLPSLALALLALVLTACGGAGSSDVAATVGDTEITLADLDEAFARRTEGSGAASEIAADESGAVEENLKAGVLTNLIRTEILRQAAEERNIEVSDAEIAEQRDLLIEQAGGEDALQEVIAEANVTDAELEANLRDQVIQNKITAELADDVSEGDVKAAFEEDPQGQFGEKLELRHILTEKEAEAEAAIDRIKSGEDFAAVAEDVSIDPGSAENGGDLGEVPKGATVPEFEKAAFGADEGEIVGPVKTDFGFHVIEVTGQVPAAELADVESQIRTELEAASGGQAFNTYISEFVSSLDIEVDEQFGRWDAATVAVVPADDGSSSELPITPSELPVNPSDLPS